MAPEVIRAQPYDSKADVYSYAMILYELATKTLPFVQMGMGINTITEKKNL